MMKKIQKVRKQGYATDFGELNDGVHCIAAPVYNYRNKVVAALSVSGPAVRLTKEKTRALKPRVLEASVEISEKFGFIHEGR